MFSRTDYIPGLAKDTDTWTLPYERLVDAFIALSALVGQVGILNWTEAKAYFASQSPAVPIPNGYVVLGDSDGLSYRLFNDPENDPQLDTFDSYGKGTDWRLQDSNIVFAPSAANSVIITAAGASSWTNSNDTKRGHLIMVGGGGGGNGDETIATGGGGGGGGSGAYVESANLDLDGVGGVNFVVGAGGLAGVNGTPDNVHGAAGGDTTYDDGVAVLTAGGGSAGVSGAENGGLGGTPTGGELSFNGSHGGHGGDPSAVVRTAGYGGAGSWGHGGVSPTIDVAGRVPNGPGGGGHGGMNTFEPSAGHQGIIIFTPLN